jgi:hypothetical protein
MILSLYVALEIFLLVAVRNPTAHRSLIGFATWSSFVPAVTMSILGTQNSQSTRRISGRIGCARFHRRSSDLASSSKTLKSGGNFPKRESSPGPEAAYVGLRAKKIVSRYSFRYT